MRKNLCLEPTPFFLLSEDRCSRSNGGAPPYPLLDSDQTISFLIKENNSIANALFVSEAMDFSFRIDPVNTLVINDYRENQVT